MLFDDRYSDVEITVNYWYLLLFVRLWLGIPQASDGVFVKPLSRVVHRGVTHTNTQVRETFQAQIQSTYSSEV